MSFSHLSYSENAVALLDSSGIRVVTLGNLNNEKLTGLTFVFTPENYTAGSVSASIQGSSDGVTYREMGPDLSVTIQGAVVYLRCNGSFPPYLRITLTPSGYAGSISASLRSSHRVAFTSTEL